MKVQIQLRKLLEDRKLDKRGIMTEIAAATQLDRRVISKYYNAETSLASLEVLGKLSAWLAQHGVPTDHLPGSLIGFVHTELWPALADRGQVDLHLGEYWHRNTPAPAWRAVSRRDAAAAADFVHQFSSPQAGVKPPEIRFQYTPLQFPLEQLDTRSQPLSADIAAAAEAFKAMRVRRRSASSILIGSQRVNYLLEHYVANLFGCTAFEAPVGRPRVPFFFVYRPGDHHTPSCFGGLRNPFNRSEADTPGLHYLQSLRGGGRWKVRPFKDRSDGGLVIIVQDRETRAIELAIAGFSGRSTEALGRQLISSAGDFWPPRIATRDKDIGIHICLFDFEDREEMVSPNRDDVHVRHYEPIRMDEQVIRKFLA